MIYIQSNNKIPMWDFGSSALHGCLNEGKSYKLCEDWNMPGADATCLVGSVEWCQKWLVENNHTVPKAIDLRIFEDFLFRDIEVKSVQAFFVENEEWPIFIKPFSDIKAFTGTIVKNKFDAEIVLQDYKGDLMVQTAMMDMNHEWRVYVNRRKIVGCKHYSGPHTVFPDSDFIRRTVEFALTKLDNVSFTLDFAVVEGVTLLIEPNDGWAIGNYGLEPDTYLRFCEDRWKQMIK